MDYKRAYEEALERARDLHDNQPYGEPGNWWTCEQIFPELKKSEDEEIRKAIHIYLDWLDGRNKDYQPKGDYSIKDMIAWLEKQGEKLPVGFYYVNSNGEKFYSDTLKYGDVTVHVEKQGGQILANSAKTCKDEQKHTDKSKPTEHSYITPNSKFFQWIYDRLKNVYNENPNMDYMLSLKERIEDMQEHADKVEPKFKVGDWIVIDNPCQIESIDSNGNYIVRYCDAEETHLLSRNFCDSHFHLWTIQDAKDGDVLCYKDEISLYKHDIKNCTKQETTFGGFVYHCCYDSKRFVMDSLYSLTEQDKMDIHPATKEQRDLLFQKIKEAGYEWDADKKELKKVEPKFKVGDFIINEHGFIMQIDDIDGNMYVYHVVDDNHILKYDITKTEKSCHLWTIEDAKDGDVLASNNGDIILVKESRDSSWGYRLSYHCAVLHDGTFEPREFHVDPQKFYPATKEQRDLLFQKMNEADYEWDTKKKELKEIKIAPKFKVGDLIKEKRDKYGDSTIKIEGIDSENYYYFDKEFPIKISEQDNWELVEQKPTDKIEPKFKVGDVFTKKYTRDTIPIKVYEISYDANEPIYKLKPIRLCGDDVILGEEALIELYNKIN